MTPLESARDLIRRHAMLAGGEVVLVAVSGGADSVALLHLLAALAPEWRLSLHVAHVDHRLRPESWREADFARELGHRLGVPVHVLPVDVERRGSLEAAARTARYRALEACADRLGVQRIAVGHTADDQAETVLMRVLAGSGVRGLAGIPPVRGRVIRPLLATRRQDLQAVLERAGLTWVEDPSNRDPKFLRNRIRHDVLPLLAAWDGDVVEALVRVAGSAREAVDGLDRIAAAELDRLASVERDGLVLPLQALGDLPAPVAAEVLRAAVARLVGPTPLRAWAHRGLGRVLARPAPRRALRFAGVIVEVSVGRVRVARGPASTPVERALDVPGRVSLPEIDAAIGARLVDAAGYVVPRDATRAAFDADALPRSLVVRARRRGDRFAPFGAPGARRLKAFLIDARIPRWERGRLAIVEANGEIVWIAGLRRGAAAPVTARTRTVVELSIETLAQ